MGASLPEKRLMDIFPEIKNNEIISGICNNIIINGIKIYKKSKYMEIIASSDALLSCLEIQNIEKYLETTFKLENVKVKTKFSINKPIENILAQYKENLIQILTRKNPSCRILFKDSDWKIDGERLHIKLKNCSSQILKTRKCDVEISEILEQSFDAKLNVVFKDEVLDDKHREKYLRFKAAEEIKAAEKAAEYVFGRDVKGGADLNEKPAAAKNTSPVIRGKGIKEEPDNLSEVTGQPGPFTAWGDVISVDFRETKRKTVICSFGITDYTGSVLAKMFLKPQEADNVKKRLKKGVRVKIRGNAGYDDFEKDYTIMVRDVVAVPVVERLDKARKKRVELHLHTQMSSMDAVSPVSELIEQAAKWGHKAVAITDHGVVQAFPDAYYAAKKNNLKIIYGMECYLVDDGVPIVYNPENRKTDGRYVVMDIETTGLIAGKNKITEIGAVKVEDGKIIDTFQSFVNPGVPIPPKITSLTGIDDGMVKDAPKIGSVLEKLELFIADSTIVAHNAPFDMGFIRYEAAKEGKVILNPVIDTLQLCRQMFGSLKRHKLDAVAKHLKIDMGTHHRALDDAVTTARILVECLERLKEKGVCSADEIQNAFENTGDYKKVKSYHAIIFVKNMTGLKNLYKIVSESHLNYYYKKPRVPRKLLMTHREGLLLTNACEAGELFRAVLENKSSRELERIAGFYDFLEIQPLGNNEFLLNNGQVESMERLKDINREIVRLGEKLEKPVIATCDVHFMNPRDEVFRRILMAGQGFSDADRQAPLYFRTTDEMLLEFQYLGQEKAYEVVVENTNLAADLIEEISPVPDGTFPPIIEGAEDEIKVLTENKAKEIYGDVLPGIVKERMDKELNSIIKNGFSVMYITAQKLVSRSLEDGYLVGSRGSVGSSLVANMAGITEVNSLPAHYICENCKYSEFITDGSVGCGYDLPDKDCPQCSKPLKKDGYDIPFETFLGFDGDKEPDIDLNFSGEYQPVAHKYTEKLFGQGHVFRAGTIATIASKTAYGFVKGYVDERDMTITNAEINRLVEGCSGIKRTTGQHPGGVMIVPHDREIYEFCPIQRPADDVESNIITTHFDYHSISGKLLKLDILGHDDPTVIKMLEDLTGVDARSIPIAEKKTMGLFRSTEPLGIKPEDIDSEVGTFAIPEFGTRFVRQMLVDTRPTTFSELIRISGLSHGTDVWVNNAQELIRANTASLSEVICTRDDIMLYLFYAGLPPKVAFKIMEDVRKGKGLTCEYEKIMKDNRVPNWYIESCKKIKYMFPKAHAAAYVMMAFRIAWFKVYYPEAFYVTYFTVRADDFDAEIMTHGQDRVKSKIKEFDERQKNNNLSQKEKNIRTILEVANEMYARGINFLPVDLYKSDANKFLITPEGIRPPLNALQGLGLSAAQNILKAREESEFTSIDELKMRAKISKAVIEILEKNGCLDGMPESNQISMFG